MGYGPIKNGKQMPITPYEGSWVHQEEQKKGLPVFEIETKAPFGKWERKYGVFHSEAQAMFYWRGQSAHNGHKARLKRNGKVIEEKGE